MRFGLYFDLRNRDGSRDAADLYARALDLCARGEELGADSVWVSEHHAFADGYLPQPLTFLAAVAARTSRVRLGTAVLLAGLRDAVTIAEQAAVVDILSRGRLELGLGGGYRPAEFALFDVRARTPLATLFARRDELRGIWEKGVVTPAPLQAHPSIWLGCNGPVGARRAGLVGEPLLSAIPALWEHYREGLVAGGHDPATARMSGPVNVFLTDDPERDTPAIAAAYAYLWDTYGAAMVEGTDEPLPTRIDPERALRKGLAGGQIGLLVATPEVAAAALSEYYDGIPIDTLFTWSMLPGIDPALTDRHLELWSGMAERMRSAA